MGVPLVQGNTDLHVQVPQKFKQLAFEQGIPLTAMVLRGLTYKYDGKISNFEAITKIRMELAGALRECERAGASHDSIREVCYKIDAICEAMVYWEG